MSDKAIEIICGVSVLMIMILLLVVWVFKGSMTAEVYNRETNSNITTWEAMWVNTRLDCNANSRSKK